MLARPALTPREARYSTAALIPAMASKLAVPVSHLEDWLELGQGRRSVQAVSLYGLSDLSRASRPYRRPA